MESNESSNVTYKHKIFAGLDAGGSREHENIIIFKQYLLSTCVGGTEFLHDSDLEET